MSGRPPTPTAIRVLEGVRGHRPLRREPVAPGLPACPSWLRGPARKLWNSLIPELQSMNLIGTIDATELAMLCTTWSRWRATEAALDANPFDASLHRQASKLRMDTLSLFRDFGMNPVARVRVAPTPPPADDTMGGLLK
jgi:P27 family predicted phage terminase small subunit